MRKDQKRGNGGSFRARRHPPKIQQNDTTIQAQTTRHFHSLPDIQTSSTHPSTFLRPLALDPNVVKQNPPPPARPAQEGPCPEGRPRPTAGFGFVDRRVTVVGHVEGVAGDIVELWSGLGGKGGWKKKDTEAQRKDTHILTRSYWRAKDLPRIVMGKAITRMPT